MFHILIYLNSFKMIYVRYDMQMLCYMWWNDMFTIWYVKIGYVWWHARDMICEFYDMVWYDTLENMISLWYDICSDMNDIWYDWYPIWWIDIMHDPDIRMESYDKMIWYKGKHKRGCYTLWRNEKCWDLMHHCVFIHRGIPLLLLRWYGCEHYEAGKWSLCLL